MFDVESNLPHATRLFRRQSQAWHDKVRGVLARYSEPHRKYHDPQHVEQMFALYEEHTDAVLADHRNRAAVEIAIAYHDAVYLVERDRPVGANEKASAVLAVHDLNDLSALQGLIDQVEAMILNTVSHTCERCSDADKLLIDLDLAPLADTANYWSNNRHIREEYTVYTDEEFAAGRAEFLKSFLGREAIFLTERFRNLFESAARANMNEELKALEM